MSETRRPSLPTTDAGWTVRQMVPRTEWRSGTEPCPACGATVRLDGAHYQVELDRERSPNASAKLTRERRLLSFCDEACVADWITVHEE